MSYLIRIQLINNSKTGIIWALLNKIIILKYNKYQLSQKKEKQGPHLIHDNNIMLNWKFCDYSRSIKKKKKIRTNR